MSLFMVCTALELGLAFRIPTPIIQHKKAPIMATAPFSFRFIIAHKEKSFQLLHGPYAFSRRSEACFSLSAGAVFWRSSLLASSRQPTISYQPRIQWDFPPQALVKPADSISGRHLISLLGMKCLPRLCTTDRHGLEVFSQNGVA